MVRPFQAKIGRQIALIYEIAVITVTAHEQRQRMWLSPLPRARTSAKQWKSDVHVKS